MCLVDTACLAHLLQEGIEQVGIEDIVVVAGIAASMTVLPLVGQLDIEGRLL